MKLYKLLPLLLLVGCVQRVLVKPGATQAAVNMDNAACEMEATRMLYAPGAGVIEGAWAAAKMKSLCLQSKGYQSQ